MTTLWIHHYHAAGPVSTIRPGHPTKICAWPSVVHSLLQPDHTVSPIHRWHAAPSRLVHRQHTHRAVRSRWVNHWHQTVVPTEWSTAQPERIGGSDHRNHQSAACSDVIRVICVCGGSGPASSWKESKCWRLCSIGAWHFTRTSRWWRDCANIMHRPSDTFDIC